MKTSTKITSIVIIFFLIIATVIIGRTMIGNHFQKKFSKRPPPGIIVTEVVEKEFSEKIETFGTAISKKSKTFKIKRDDLFGDLKLKNFVKKGETLIKLKSGNIIAPFSGVLGYTGLTEDILVSNNIIIITLDDNSVIYSDIKIPENYSAYIKKGLPVDVKITSYKNNTLENIEAKNEPLIDEEDVNSNIEIPPQRDIRDSQPTISVNYRVVKNTEENNLKRDQNYSRNNDNEDDWASNNNDW